MPRSDGRGPVARKRFYLGGPVLVFLIYFFGHLYPWARACLARSIPEARDAHSPPSPAPVRMVSFWWCLAMTLDRLNTIGPSGAADPALPSERLSFPSSGKTDNRGTDPDHGQGQD